MQKLKSIGKKSYLLVVIAVFVAASAMMLTPRTTTGQDEQSINALRSQGKAFAAIYQKTSPAVVGIKVEIPATDATYSPYHQWPDDTDPFEYFFRRQAPQQQQPKTPRKAPTTTAQGSGFIISDDGYILTNNHLVGEAKKVHVELEDDRKFEAKIIGSDPESDVAVIKIDANNLPFIQLADSDKLEVGEWVLAIGSPFGLKSSLTAGIVSAKGRNNVGLTTYENFIQTDAAINFGNSGGPLLNLDGKAVGINSAILGPSGNIGIGFAIPINMAKNIYHQLRDTGEIVRGFLGVLPQDIDPDMAKMFGLDNGSGVAITQVTPDSAADKAGFKHNDVVLEIDGKAVTSASGFRSRIARYKPGEKVDITVWRDGKKKVLTATLDKRPSMEELAAGATGGMNKPSVNLGFSVQDLTDELAERLGYEGDKGVLVTSVDPGSAAEREGITAGTLILEVNRKVVTNTRDFYKRVNQSKDNGKVMLLIKRNDQSMYVLIPIED